LESPVLFQHFFGDVAVKTFSDLCILHLEPALTNYYRFDIDALNGSYWQIISFNKTTNGWAMNLKYRWSRFGDKVEIEPPEMKGSILIH
jgi:hypothetical protein